MGKGGGGVSIPSNYSVRLGGLNGGIVQIDSDLDNIQINKIAPLELRVKEIPVLTINSNVAVTQLPVIRSEGKTDVNFSLKEVPEMRIHLPAHYQVELSLFGFEILKLGFCGESQVINEKYVPRQAEVCN